MVRISEDLGVAGTPVVPVEDLTDSAAENRVVPEAAEVLAGMAVEMEAVMEAEEEMEEIKSSFGVDVLLYSVAQNHI